MAALSLNVFRFRSLKTLPASKAEFFTCNYCIQLRIKHLTHIPFRFIFKSAENVAKMKSCLFYKLEKITMHVFF